MYLHLTGQERHRKDRRRGHCSRSRSRSSVCPRSSLSSSGIGRRHIKVGPQQATPGEDTSSFHEPAQLQLQPLRRKLSPRRPRRAQFFSRIAATAPCGHKPDFGDFNVTSFGVVHCKNGRRMPRTCPAPHGSSLCWTRQIAYRPSQVVAPWSVWTWRSPSPLGTLTTSTTPLR